MKRYGNLRGACPWFLLAIFVAALPVAAQTRADSEAKAETNPPAAVVDEFDALPILEVDPDNPYQAREPEEQAAEPILVREGKRLFDCEGRIVRADNESQFVFTSGDAPVTLMPCKPLERIEELSRFGTEPLVFRVAGVVTEYRKRNFLLLTDYPRLSPEGEEKPATPEPASTPGTESQAEVPEGGGRDRDQPPEPVDAGMPELPPVRQTATRPREVGPPTLLSEDKRLIDREGRVVREGRLTLFVFDTGDPPIALLPNRKLERMEDIAEYGRSPMRFRISGRVTEYRGRNYLLMSKMLVIPKAIEKL